jgi:RNA recognition motif-containing protein
MLILSTEFGKVVFVRVHRKGSYGFVGFQDHWSAVKAIFGMHGKVVHDRVRQN